jgi:hypothetical protein
MTDRAAIVIPVLEQDSNGFIVMNTFTRTRRTKEGLKSKSIFYAVNNAFNRLRLVALG